MPRRIVIVGGPHTGKTTLSTRLGVDTVHHSDDIKHLGWSEASAEASKWFSEQGEWVCEGVQMARALRKWLAANPDEPLDADIIKLSEPFDLLNTGQESMSKGIETVFGEIEPELIRRGARIHRFTNPDEAIDLVQRQNMPEKTDAKPDNTSEGDGKNTEGKDKAGTQTETEDAPKFTQKDQDALAAKIRKEEKEKFEKKEADAKRLADDAKAKEQGEFEKLANDRQVEIDQLKPKLEAATKELEAYKEKVSEMVKTALRELPEEVRDISPTQYGEDKSITNPLDVLAWLPKGKTLADKLNGAPPAPGAKGDPKPKSGPGDAEKEKQARSSARREYQSL